MKINYLIMALKYNVRRQIRRMPFIYIPLMRWRWSFWRLIHKTNGGPEVINRKTNILIEAFPRSGNSFAYAAFFLSQKGNVKIAHHIHASAHVIAAVRKKLPTLVLIRDPDDAVLSLHIFDPNISLKNAYKDYISFYKTILPYRKYFILTTFESVTNDFGLVIQELNKKYGTSFTQFDHSKDNVDKCFKFLNNLSKKEFGTSGSMTIPSKNRKLLKEQIRQQIYSKELKLTREYAFKLYNQLAKTADVGKIK